MLLYQRCIVTKLFKKKKRKTKQNVGLYYTYILLALCSVFQRGILHLGGDKMPMKFVSSMYLPDAVALFCTERYVFWNLFSGCFCLFWTWRQWVDNPKPSPPAVFVASSWFVFMYWLVILANMNIQTVVALSRNIISIWTCIFSSFHLNIK